MLAAFLYSTIINHRSLEDSVIYRICERLDHPDMQANLLRQTFDEMLEDWPEWGSILRVDIQAVYDRDPACRASSRRCSISRASMRCRPIGWRIGC